MDTIENGTGDGTIQTEPTEKIIDEKPRSVRISRELASRYKGPYDLKEVTIDGQKVAIMVPAKPSETTNRKSDCQIQIDASIINQGFPIEFPPPLPEDVVLPEGKFDQSHLLGAESRNNFRETLE